MERGLEGVRAGRAHSLQTTRARGKTTGVTYNHHRQPRKAPIKNPGHAQLQSKGRRTNNVRRKKE